MASIAHAAHPSQHDFMVRAEVAAQGVDHMAFSVELLARLVKRMTVSVKSTIQRWAAAHQQAVQDRMFWELALTDPRMMAELHAIIDHAKSAGKGYEV